MEGITGLDSNSFENQFHDGVAAPENPSAFLLKLLDNTEDGIRPDDAEGVAARIQERREKMRSVITRLPEISQHMIEAYRDVCNRHELQPGTITLYAVGGRVNGKPLRDTSDIDVVFVIANPEGGLQPKYGLRASDSDDLIAKKTVARNEFIQALNAGFEKLDLLDKNENGKVTGWFIEPKGYGDSGEAIRQEWAALSKEAGNEQLAVRLYSQDA